MRTNLKWIILAMAGTSMSACESPSASSLSSILHEYANRFFNPGSASPIAGDPAIVPTLPGAPSLPTLPAPTATPVPTIPTSSLNQLRFNYSLSSAVNTSAGIYSPDNKLIRTLWSGVRKNAGTYTGSWDGKDESGVEVAHLQYRVKIKSSGINYVWEGVIGNTSSSFTRDVWRSINSPEDIGFSSGTGLMALNYNEGQSNLKYFDAGSPQSAIDLTPADANSQFRFLAADGDSFYTASNNSGWDSSNLSYVVRFNAVTKVIKPFPNGINVRPTGPWGSSGFTGVIDVNTKAGSDTAFMEQKKISGIAVQRSGNILAVAHVNLNEVHLFDKTSGARIGTLSVPTPKRMSFSASGKLWLITGNEARKFENQGSASAPNFTQTSTISGFSSALAISASPLTEDLILIADGGSAQQVKAFNSSGQSLWTYGQAGGYATNGPNVTNDKLFFRNFDPLSEEGMYGVESAFLGFQEDGSFWISDRGNIRVLHISAARQYVGQISFMPDRLKMAIDPNNPTRVFSEWLEYAVDYSQALSPGTGWRLSKNWLANNFNFSRYGSFSQVVTLPNGRTYAQLHDNNYNSGANYYEIAELPTSGPLRLTGVRVDEYGNGNQNHDLYKEGDLRYWKVDWNQRVMEAYSRPLTGFDSSGNPAWGPGVLIARASGLDMDNDPLPNVSWYMKPKVAVTDSGMVISYQCHTVPRENTFHLGAIQKNSTEWNWKASRGKTIDLPDGQGTFSEKTGYGGHDGIAVFAEGNQVFYGFDGQNGSYSNQYMHYMDDGLFVGQFGEATDQTYPSDPRQAQAGNGGNVGYMSVVRANGRIYLYHVDEAMHAGVHRWRVDNLDSIQDQSQYLVY